jgi:hypothetical protein
MLLAALVVPLVLWAVVERRRARFEHLFSYHRGQAGPVDWRSFVGDTPIFTTEKGRWHDRLAAKYAEAARRPWLPVEDDPPEPK